MSYTDVEFVNNVLQDDFLRFPSDLSQYDEFAQTIINSKLAGQYAIPFDDTNLYTSVPVLIKWIASYLVGYKMFDRATSTQELPEGAGQKWWDMAMSFLDGIVAGDYLLHLDDGTVVEVAGSTTGPRAYPTGVREKAPATFNVPYFTREQAGQW